jgi:hypothetical protein
VFLHWNSPHSQACFHLSKSPQQNVFPKIATI